MKRAEFVGLIDQCGVEVAKQTQTKYLGVKLPAGEKRHAHAVFDGYDPQVKMSWCAMVPFDLSQTRLTKELIVSKMQLYVVKPEVVV